MIHTNPIDLEKSMLRAVKLNDAIDTTFQWEKWLPFILI